MLNKPGWLNRFLVLLGDASYSIYLFHLWVLEWIIPRLISGYHHFHSDPKSPTLAIGVCVVAASKHAQKLEPA